MVLVFGPYDETSSSLLLVSTLRLSMGKAVFQCAEGPRLHAENQDKMLGLAMMTSVEQERKQQRRVEHLRVQAQVPIRYCPGRGLCIFLPHPWQNHVKNAMAPDWTRGGRAKRGPPVSSVLPWQLLRDFAMGGAWVGQKYTQPPSRTILPIQGNQNFLPLSVFCQCALANDCKLGHVLRFF